MGGSDAPCRAVLMMGGGGGSSDMIGERECVERGRGNEAAGRAWSGFICILPNFHNIVKRIWEVLNSCFYTLQKYIYYQIIIVYRPMPLLCILLATAAEHGYQASIQLSYRYYVRLYNSWGMSDRNSESKALKKNDYKCLDYSYFYPAVCYKISHS